VLRPALPEGLNGLEPKALQAELRKEFARLAAEDAGAREAQIAADTAQPVAEPAFTLSARRRVRHWVDGLVIGSELFVRETMRRFRTEPEVARHRLARAEAASVGREPICCWRRLRGIRA